MDDTGLIENSDSATHAWTLHSPVRSDVQNTVVSLIRVKIRWRGHVLAMLRSSVSEALFAIKTINRPICNNMAHEYPRRREVVVKSKRLGWEHLPASRALNSPIMAAFQCHQQHQIDRPGDRGEWDNYSAAEYLRLNSGNFAEFARRSKNFASSALCLQKVHKSSV